MEVDANGWAVGVIAALPVADAFTLLAPEPGSAIDGARLRHHAHTFLSTRLELVQAKKYPGGTSPVADAVEVDVARAGAGDAPTRVLVVTVPLAHAEAARTAGEAAARAIGGAGFDVLVARARRVFQVAARPVSGGDDRAPLALAAALASVLLAPIVPPEGGTIFGVKGARLRLEARR
jgi:hypothetical protein